MFLLNNTSGDLDQYKIAKAIFLSDFSHLNKFGRPVTYDNYVAMAFGPVPSKTYDALKRTPEKLDVAVSKQQQNNKFYKPLRQHEETELSKSDEAELLAALDTVETSSFQELKALTHDFAAWKDARTCGGNNAPSMDYALLFETPDQEQAAYIARLSRQDECTR